MATIKQLMTLLGRAGIREEARREMIYNFTGGRTQSARDLNTKELLSLCNKLQANQQQDQIELIMRRKRSVVLTIATRTGIKEPNGWSKFNLWMKNRSIFKKELHNYDFDELDQLVRQFRGLEANFNRSAEKPGTKAWHQATGIPDLNPN
ncbi:MAG: hypothetical protein U1C58_06180 [Flavobacteriaceae bacterium]|nr:hypothetical protein [Flavobacteriaceae bacterium]MDZ4147852.1 hypothetical protein [Flavobacteriaceae bacterium]